MLLLVVVVVATVIDVDGLGRSRLGCAPPAAVDAAADDDETEEYSFTDVTRRGMLADVIVS